MGIVCEGISVVVRLIPVMRASTLKQLLYLLASATIISDRRANSIWQFQIIFYSQTTSNADIYIKIICRRAAHLYCLLFISGVFETNEKTLLILFWSNRSIFVFSSWHKNSSVQFRFRWSWVQRDEKRTPVGPRTLFWRVCGKFICIAKKPLLSRK